MTRLLTTLLLLFLVIPAYGAFEGNYTPGAVEKQGIDPGTAVYRNNTGDLQLNPRFQALKGSTVRENESLPSQMIIIGPRDRITGGLDQNSVAESCRQYLESSGLLDDRLELKVVSRKLVMEKIWFVSFQNRRGSGLRRYQNGS
jgi:hypothetical protein